MTMQDQNATVQQLIADNSTKATHDIDESVCVLGPPPMKVLPLKVSVHLLLALKKSFSLVTRADEIGNIIQVNCSSAEGDSVTNSLQACLKHHKVPLLESHDFPSVFLAGCNRAAFR